MGQSMSALNALADQMMKQALERLEESMGDNTAYMKAIRMTKGLENHRIPTQQNVEVDCAYCGKSFVTAKGGTQGECPSCGAPMRKGPRGVKGYGDK